jgi:hypothetical protein
MLLGLEPGEAFVVRNVAALVHPYHEQVRVHQHSTHHIFSKIWSGSKLDDEASRTVIASQTVQGFFFQFFEVGGP